MGQGCGGCCCRIYTVVRCRCVLEHRPCKHAAATMSCALQAPVWTLDLPRSLISMCLIMRVRADRPIASTRFILHYITTIFVAGFHACTSRALGVCADLHSTAQDDAHGQVAD